MRDLAGKGGLVWYYLATPLFAFLDLGLGLPLRVAGLADPVHRALYYLVLVALGGVLAYRPRLGPWVGMGESVVNLFLLLLSILLPIWSLSDEMLAGGDGGGPLGLAGLLNAFIVGVVLVVVFHRNQAALARPWGRGGL